MRMNAEPWRGRHAVSSDLRHRPSGDVSWRTRPADKISPGIEHLSLKLNLPRVVDRGGSRCSVGLLQRAAGYIGLLSSTGITPANIRRRVPLLPN